MEINNAIDFILNEVERQSNEVTSDVEIISERDFISNEIVRQDTNQENVFKNSYQLRSKLYPKRKRKTNQGCHKGYFQNKDKIVTINNEKKNRKIKIGTRKNNKDTDIHSEDEGGENQFENCSEKTLLIHPPEGMEIKKSLIPNAGLGVFATQIFDIDIIFGPYQGIKIPLDVPMDERDTSYMWRVMKDGVDVYYIDGKDERYANWMRYINCSRYETEQNLEAFHCQGEIYYRIYKQVEKGKEFLVWYGDDYAKDLGIEGTYQCRKCSECFTSEFFLKSHMARCYANRIRGRKNRIQTLSKVDRDEFTIDLTTCFNDNAHKTFVGFEESGGLTDLTGQSHSTTTTGQSLTQSGNNSLKCTYCEYECSTVSDLTKHIGNHLSKKLYRCSYCDYKCMHRHVMTKHMQVHCYKKSFKCTQCLYKSATKERLERHFKKHFTNDADGQLNYEKPFKCQYCDYRTADKIDLKRHSKSHYIVKLHKCTFCSYISKERNNFTLHMRTHTGEKPYKCSHCEYKCAQRSNLTVHLRIHSDDKPFKCTYCNYECKQKANLTLHTRTHTQVKPYKCPFCNYKCSTKLSITMHKRVHTLEKPFQCSFCDYKCSCKSYIKVHERTHTKDKPFKCDVCKYASSVKSNLTKHLKLHI